MGGAELARRAHLHLRPHVQSYPEGAVCDRGWKGRAGVLCGWVPESVWDGDADYCGHV